MGNVQRAKDSKYVFRRLWQYLSHHRALFLFCLLLALISNVLALIGPRLSGRAINAIDPGQGKVDFPTVFYYAGLMLGAYLLSAGMTFILNRSMIRLSQKLVHSIRKDLFNKLVELPVSYFDRNTTGDIVSRISYDIDTIGASLSNDLLQIITSAVTVIGCLLMMITIKPVLCLIFCVSIPVTVLLTRYRNKVLRPLFHTRSVKLGQLNGYSEEMISGMKTVKAYNREQYYIDRFDGYNNEAADAYYQADYYASVLGPSMNMINNITLAFLSVIGALMYMATTLSLGDLSSFILYSRRFTGPINEIANIFSELQSAFAAAERVFLLIDEAPEPADAPEAVVIKDVQGKVDLDQIDFGYTPEKTVLHDLNLHARPGELTAIVGPTGAGKTTLINLLMRFYDPQRGTVLVDGLNAMNITRKSLRLAYSMVLQDTWLFTGTIYENIAYGRPDAGREEVEAAAKAAHIHDFIMHLPQGYDTVLTEDGTTISKGQKQLLTIARAMLLSSPMLILDEATSNVDTQTEIHIQAAMRELMKDRTCFVIAHRLSTIQNADHILVINDGTVVEQGTHQELLSHRQLYAQLYNSQFS